MSKESDVRCFIELVESWNASGWAEYLLWETLAGVRDRPFKFLEPLSEEQRAMLTRLRDEHKSWLYYDKPSDGWEVVDVTAWQLHARDVTADDIRTALERTT